MRGLLKRLILGLLAVVLLLAIYVGWVFGRFTLNLQHFAADPDAGYHADFYVYVPPTVARRAGNGETAFLLVQPNNTGSPNDDVAAHVKDAWWTAFGRHFLADDLQVVLLVPAFLRPRTDWTVYTHALDRDTFITARTNLARPDLQLIAMVDQLRTLLAGQKIPLASRFLIQGYSASGMFANRFAFLHPDRVLAVAAGSPGGWPIIPALHDEDGALPYPAGVSDLEALTGKPFDAAALQRVPQLIVMGDRDDNDSLDYGDGWDAEVATRIEARYGDTPLARWNAAKERYAAAGMNAEFRLVPGIGHDRRALQGISTEFLRNALSEARARNNEEP